MKKTRLLVMVFTMLLAIGLCACGQQGASSGSASSASSQAAQGKYATMGDVFESDGEMISWSCNDQRFVYAFKDAGNYMCVAIDMPEGAYQKLQDAQFSQDKLVELLGDAPIVKEEVLAEEAAIAEELDKLVGKKGSEIAAEGYEISTLSVNGDKTYCSATKLPLTYLIVFDGTVDDPKTDDMAGAVADLVVFDAIIQGVSIDALGA